jgi:hypothetical protein
MAFLVPMGTQPRHRPKWTKGGGGLKLGEFVKLFSWNKLTNSASSTMDEGGNFFRRPKKFGGSGGKAASVTLK